MSDKPVLQFKNDFADHQDALLQGECVLKRTEVGGGEYTVMAFYTFKLERQFL